MQTIETSSQRCGNSFKPKGNQNVLECLQQHLRRRSRDLLCRYICGRQCRPRIQQRRFGRGLSSIQSRKAQSMSLNLQNSFSAAFAAAVSAALFVGASILPAINNASSVMI
tara:strand:- start:1078 stop:1410 length:333 start_codon:yes stop_codon:yes gene_type:complete